MSLVSQLDARTEAVSAHCVHCSLAVEVIPAAGTRYVAGFTQEPRVLRILPMRDRKVAPMARAPCGVGWFSGAGADGGE